MRQPSRFPICCRGYTSGVGPHTMGNRSPRSPHLCEAAQLAVVALIEQLPFRIRVARRKRIARRLPKLGRCTMVSSASDSARGLGASAPERYGVCPELGVLCLEVFVSCCTGIDFVTERCAPRMTCRSANDAVRAPLRQPRGSRQGVRVSSVGRRAVPAQVSSGPGRRVSSDQGQHRTGTSEGALRQRDRSPDERAGMICVGRTSAPEFDLTATNEPHAFGPTMNPSDPQGTLGGSSGSSAARIVSMAHASDGGTSIRIPGVCCRVVGLKPTRRRNPLKPYEERVREFVPLMKMANADREPAVSLLIHRTNELPGGVQFSAQFGSDPTLSCLANRRESARPCSHRSSQEWASIQATTYRIQHAKDGINAGKIISEMVD